jgi:cyd operon protein YbgT
MWYFAWVLGVGFAVLLAVLNAMWGENEAARAATTASPDRAPAREGSDGH